MEMDIKDSCRKDRVIPVARDATAQGLGLPTGTIERSFQRPLP
jgi:hypothetical protein